MKNRLILGFMTLFALASCSEYRTETWMSGSVGNTGTSVYIDDGLYRNWNAGDIIMLAHDGQAIPVEAMDNGQTSALSCTVITSLADDNPLFGVFPARNLVSADRESVTVSVPSEQTATEEGYDKAAAVYVARTVSDVLDFRTVCGGIRLNFQMSGVTRIELESVDGYALSGEARIKWDGQELPVTEGIADGNSILVFSAPDEMGFVPGKDYYISTLPCDLYGGYRLSIYKDGLKADYFGVYQTAERAEYITPPDLVESELVFDDPDAPLVEEERPELDATTSALLHQYMQEPTDGNKQALLDQMGIRYDKVVARKKAKLRELEREAKTPNLVEEMQEIVDEMVENRDIRLEQQFLRLIDPRTDDNPDDAWMVLRGASAPDAYIGYAPVTNAEYAAFNSDFSYADGTENYPVVNVSVIDAMAYCDWLAVQDNMHSYRLPTDEEWILAAGHMPKDVSMNSDYVESGLTEVDAYNQTTGACGGIDFWGNCWEWTSSTDADGLYVVKGGSWDSSRDDCRSEKSDVVRDGSLGYANVGFRVVRTDSI